MRLLGESTEPWAALGAASAAEIYGCVVIADGVEDAPDNVTRFIWIAPAGTATSPAGEWRTTLVFSELGEDYPGALVDALHEFSSRGVNLTRIESRPRRTQIGRYMFFVDVEGAASDEPLAGAITAEVLWRKYVPWIYWLTVVLVRIVGTQITDVLTDKLEVSLYLSTATNNTATGVNSSNNSGHGIYFNNSSNNVFSDVIVANNGNYGFRLENGSDNKLSDVTAVNNAQNGVYVVTSSNNALFNITAIGHNTVGIGIALSSNNTLSGATASNTNTYGIVISSGSNVWPIISII